MSTTASSRRSARLAEVQTTNTDGSSFVERRTGRIEYDLSPSEISGRTSATLKVIKPELQQRGTFTPRLLLALWGFFMLTSLALLVAAYAEPSWVTGTVSTGVTATPYLQRDVGVFRQCNQVSGGSDGTNQNCFEVLSSANIEEWQAAGALFIVGIVFLLVTIILVVIAAICAWGILVPWAKGMMFVTNILLLVAFILVPFGFDQLSNACPTNSSDAAQCGLTCTSPGAVMQPFVLCSPYTLGTGLYLCFAALIILFFSAIFAACVRVMV